MKNFNSITNKNWDIDEIENYNDKDILEILMCKICYQFSYKIKICKKCKFIVCNICQIKIENKKCPICKINLKNYKKMNFLLKQILKTIKINCINKNFCKNIIKFDDLEYHLNNDCFIKNIKKKNHIIIELNKKINLGNDVLINIIINNTFHIKNQNIKIELLNKNKILIKIPLIKKLFDNHKIYIYKKNKIELYKNKFEKLKKMIFILVI